MKSVTIIYSRKNNSVYIVNSPNAKKDFFFFWKIMKISIKEIYLSIYMNICLKYVLI
jgi:hypothetical protein